MSKIEELFRKAYNLHVVEDNQEEAIEICRKILERDPDHIRARMMLGCILGDYGTTEEEILESKHHFMDVIKKVDNLPRLMQTAWREEDPIHQLGVWESNNKRNCSATLYFILDYLLCPEDYSEQRLVDLLKLIDENDAPFFLYLLKRIKTEFNIALKINEKRKE